MTNYPEIAYMKWDDNCSLLDYGSSYLPKTSNHISILSIIGVYRKYFSVFVPSILNS